MAPLTTPVTKRKFFPDSKEDTGLFAGFESGAQDPESVGGLVNKNLTGMLTGSAFDATRTKTREGLQRAAQNLRAQSGAANASALGQGKATKAQGATEQTIFQGLADTEMNLGVEEQAMKERGVSQAAAIGEAQQNVITQRRGQDLGAQQSREQIASAEKIAGMNLTSAEKIATQSNLLDRAKLDESARQFNISSEQASQQFAASLNRDYAELSQADRQFLATLGLDQAKFEEAKSQFQQTLEQENRLTMANLGVQERQIAEGARQFDSRLAFDQSELAANLTEAERNRVWQAVQNDKAAVNAKEIATMQNDTERWKTELTAVLTRAGWDVESANKELDRRLQETMQNKDLALNREIEAGRLTQAQAEMVQQASQFTDQLEWQKEATRLGIKADEAERIWQTSERVANQAFTAGEATLDRQLQKEIESGRLSLQERELAQQASQFTDQLTWQKEAKAQDLDDAAANRIWEAAEAAKTRTFQASMQTLQNEFTARGWNFEALMSSLDNMPEEAVAQTLNQVAADAGLTYTAGTSASGDPIVVPGLKPATTGLTARQISEVAYKASTGKGITEAELPALKSQWSDLVKSGAATTDSSVEGLDLVKWTTSGANRWEPSDAARQWASTNAGRLYQASNGRYYTVVGISSPKDRLSMGGIVFKDAVSGVEVILNRNNKFPAAGA